MIVNKKLLEDFKNNKPVRLNIGSGKTKISNYYSVDCVELYGIDIVADLNKPLLEIPDNSVEAIYSRHALEHVEKFPELMEEFWRVGKRGCSLEIVVPHFSNVYAYSDPTHVRFFGIYTMNYFCKEENQLAKRLVPSYYTNSKFIVKGIKIEFYKDGLVDKFIGRILDLVVNFNFETQEFYERRLSSLYHAWQITYLMELDK